MGLLHTLYVTCTLCQTYTSPHALHSLPCTHPTQALHTTRAYYIRSPPPHSNFDDVYDDPGSPLMRRLSNGSYVIAKLNGERKLLMQVCRECMCWCVFCCVCFVVCVCMCVFACVCFCVCVCMKSLKEKSHVALLTLRSHNTYSHHRHQHHQRTSPHASHAHTHPHTLFPHRVQVPPPRVIVPSSAYSTLIHSNALKYGVHSHPTWSHWGLYCLIRMTNLLHWMYDVVMMMGGWVGVCVCVGGGGYVAKPPPLCNPIHTHIHKQIHTKKGRKWM